MAEVLAEVARTFSEVHGCALATLDGQLPPALIFERWLRLSEALLSDDDIRDALFVIDGPLFKSGKPTDWSEGRNTNVKVAVYFPREVPQMMELGALERWMGQPQHEGLIFDCPNTRQTIMKRDVFVLSEVAEKGKGKVMGGSCSRYCCVWGRGGL